MKDNHVYWCPKIWYVRNISKFLGFFSKFFLLCLVTRHKRWKTNGTNLFKVSFELRYSSFHFGIWSMYQRRIYKTSIKKWLHTWTNRFYSENKLWKVWNDHTFLLFSLSSKEIVLDTTNATQLKGFIISNLYVGKLSSNWLA